MEYAHRLVVWAILGPQTDPRHVVMHTCNNSKCMSPFHLKYGDQRQNILEGIRRKKRGRIVVEANENVKKK